MAIIAMGVDLDFCCGCFACQSACKMINDLPDGVKWLRVMPEHCQPEEYNGKLYMDRFPVPLTLEACIACPDRADGSQPTCATACIGRALIIDEPDTVRAWAKGRRSVTYVL